MSGQIDHDLLSLVGHLQVPPPIAVRVVQDLHVQ